jgi:hypothetical protein
VRTDHVHIANVTIFQPHPSFFSDFLHILQLFFLHDCHCYYIWTCAHRPCIHQPSNLIPHFFSDFSHILQLCFISDCQGYHIWKCVHRPCMYQPSNLIPHFFLIFRIFYSYFSFMIANVTIFGNVRTDHVHINLFPHFFLIFLHILHRAIGK